MVSEDEDRSALDLLIRGFEVSRALRLVAKLKIADRIAAEASTHLVEVAEAAGVLPQPLLRMIRLLAAFGIFRVDPDGNLSHTPRSLLLRTDAPGSLHYSALFWTDTGSWRAWEALEVALKGKVPHEAAWSKRRFDYLREHPDEARVFDDFMAHFPDNRHRAIATAYDFSPARLLVDIGGGNGEALRQILSLYQDARGIVFDRPDVVDAISPENRAGGRISTEGGSFFERVPQGADIYLMIRVLHDWPDEGALRILRTCRQAMRPQSRLLLGEALVEPDPSKGRPSEYLIDLQMMAMFGAARARTELEFRDLLASAGLELLRTIPTDSSISVLEVAPRPVTGI